SRCGAHRARRATLLVRGGQQQSPKRGRPPRQAAPFPRRLTRRTPMPDHVYRIIEVAGSSQTSIEDGIASAVGRASRTLRQVSWFEVLQTRGQVESGKMGSDEVVVQVRFTLGG